MTPSKLNSNVEEADGPQVIDAAPTTVGAFVGHASDGPIDEAVRLSSFSDFERVFGGLHPNGPLSHAVHHFFLNGGSSTWVVRVADGEAERRADGPAIPTAVEILGSRAGKSGLYALEDASAFSILNLPEVTDPAALTEALDYAEERRSMMLIDMGPDVDTSEAARAWIENPACEGLRRANAVVHFPRIVVRDSVDENRARSVANSGAIAGLWARSDAAKGVWKAAAGLDAGLSGAQGLAYALNDAENGALNGLGINGLRTFAQAGVVSWGARTMSPDPTWRYVPVRRLTLLIEKNLVSGLRFAAIEPNDEPLWAQVRRRVGSFLHDLFRQGAFSGGSAREAYFVRCGADTTAEADIDAGIVNVVVGFAPLKPAEFIMIHVAQSAALPEQSQRPPAADAHGFAAAVPAASSRSAAAFALDASQVVSKYVGDMEKALAVIFATGKNGAPALPLDEADALFGKRTDVRDSHDRYANEAE